MTGVRVLHKEETENGQLNRPKNALMATSPINCDDDDEKGRNWINLGVLTGLTGVLKKKRRSPKGC